MTAVDILMLSEISKPISESSSNNTILFAPELSVRTSEPCFHGVIVLVLGLRVFLGPLLVRLRFLSPLQLSRSLSLLLAKEL